MSSVRIRLPLPYGPLVKRLRHRPFTAVTWVRFPHGSPQKSRHPIGCLLFCAARAGEPDPSGSNTKVSAAAELPPFSALARKSLTAGQVSAAECHERSEYTRTGHISSFSVDCFSGRGRFCTDLIERFRALRPSGSNTKESAAAELPPFSAFTRKSLPVGQIGAAECHERSEYTRTGHIYLCGVLQVRYPPQSRYAHQLPRKAGEPFARVTRRKPHPLRNC